jgi:outer membrane protein
MVRKNMTKMKYFLTVLFLSAGLMATNAQVKAQKIGYVSLQEVIAGMPEGKKADTALQQHYDALVANATDKQNALQSDIQKFIKDSITLSAAVKDVKRRDLQARTQELAGEEQRIQQAIEQKRQELSAPIEKKALDAVQAVAKENGYTYVLPKEAVIVGPPGDDIIALVKKKLGIK